ncbi:hypothetical protein F5X97DRAFT_284380 [Nemania serpens]|nr:hypothetical protein F5X97DRAFT_284380 [Nemania serpens]
MVSLAESATSAGPVVVPLSFTSLVTTSGTATGSGSARAFTSSICAPSLTAGLLSSTGESSGFSSAATLGGSSVVATFAGDDSDELLSEDSGFDFPFFPFFWAFSAASLVFFCFLLSFLREALAFFLAAAVSSFSASDSGPCSGSGSGAGPCSGSGSGSGSASGSKSGSRFGTAIGSGFDCSGSGTFFVLCFFFFFLVFFSCGLVVYAGPSSRGEGPAVYSYVPLPSTSLLSASSCSVSDNDGLAY